MIVYTCVQGPRRTVPLMLSRVPAGFPSPAEDYLDTPLDFNDILIAHPAATFAVWVEGESMTGEGIFPGDMAVIDRAMTPVDGSIILAVLDGAFTIKRYRHRGGERWLEAANPAFANIPLNESNDFQVWGVVRRSIRMFR